MNTANTIQEINELIEICDYKKAKKLAKGLIRKQIRDGYYLLTTLYDNQNKTDKCIKTLLHGLEKYPDDWILWMRLGNYQSDKEEYDEALSSFEKSLEQNDADEDIIDINLAILFNRWGKLDKATEVIDKIATGRYDIRKLSVQMLIQMTNEDYQKVLNSVQKNKDILSHPTLKDNQDLALIYYFYAFASWKTGNTLKAKDLIKQSLIYDRVNPQTYWLIREIDSNYSNDNKYFRILLTGNWLDEDEKDKAFGFYSTFDIVAETTEIALDLIKEYESAPIQKDSIEIEEVNELDFNPKENPAGIYNVNGFSIYEK